MGYWWFKNHINVKKSFIIISRLTGFSVLFCFYTNGYWFLCKDCVASRSYNCEVKVMFSLLLSFFFQNRGNKGWSDKKKFHQVHFSKSLKQVSVTQSKLLICLLAISICEIKGNFTEWTWMHVYDLVSRDGDRSFYFILFFDDEVQIKYLKLWIRLKSNLY